MKAKVESTYVKDPARRKKAKEEQRARLGLGGQRDRIALLQQQIANLVERLGIISSFKRSQFHAYAVEVIDAQRKVAQIREILERMESDLELLDFALSEIDISDEEST